MAEYGRRFMRLLASDGARGRHCRDVTGGMRTSTYRETLKEWLAETEWASVMMRDLSDSRVVQQRDLARATVVDSSFDVGGMIARFADAVTDGPSTWATVRVDELGQSRVTVLVGDSQSAHEAVIQHLGNPLFVVRWNYRSTYAFPWGVVTMVTRFEWWGARFLGTDGSTGVVSTLASDAGRSSIPTVRRDLIEWLDTVLQSSQVPAAIALKLNAASRIDRSAFEEAAESAVGYRAASTLSTLAGSGRTTFDQSQVRWVRAAVVRRALRAHPFETMRGGAERAFDEMRHRIRPPLPWIAVLGPDGAGKSSVIDELRRLVPNGPWGVVTRHWRPGALSGLASDGGGPVTDPHAKEPRGLISSIMKIVFLVTDWWIGFSWTLARERATGALLVFDRHLVDLTVDPRRYRYGGPEWLPRLAARFSPRPHAFVILDAPVEVLQSRKREVTEAECERQRKAYRDAAGWLPRSHVIDASRDVASVAQDVLAIAVDCARVRQGVVPSERAMRDT